MTFDDTIKIYAAAAEDNHDFGDEVEDDQVGSRHRFDDEDDLLDSVDIMLPTETENF